MENQTLNTVVKTVLFHGYSCTLQTNSFGLVNRHIFRPTDRNAYSLILSVLPGCWLVSTCLVLDIRYIAWLVERKELFRAV